MTRIILSLFLLVITSSQAQQSQTDAFWSKVRYGGSFGLSFGNNGSSLQLAPSAIYQANPYFATGLGLQLNYAQFGDLQFIGYGGSILGLFNPTQNIQLSTELEQWRINREESLDGGNREENYWLTSLFFGIGYRTNTVTFGIRYDVLFDENRSLTIDPWVPFVRVYF
ncbi:MAG: alpha-ketoglutarate decarboxylase [Bacteroidota bacterium]